MPDTKNDKMKMKMIMKVKKKVKLKMGRDEPLKKVLQVQLNSTDYRMYCSELKATLNL